VYGKLKYLYDDKCNIISKENEFVNIIKNELSDVLPQQDNDIVNKFDGIFWINLDRSTERKKNLKQTKIIHFVQMIQIYHSVKVQHP
jgi:hypothetical protein